MTQTTARTIEFTRVNSDVNGNPRQVCHFLELVNRADENAADYMEKTRRPFHFSTHYLYEIAVMKARKIGGAKYKGKNYGGGIVFQTYEKSEEAAKIAEMKREPIFVKEFPDFRKTARQLKNAICKHFAWQTINTNNGPHSFTFTTHADIDSFFGLAYTSTGAYAGLWVCNVQAECTAFPGFHYEGFTTDGNGNFFAILQDSEENEKILPLY